MGKVWLKKDYSGYCAGCYNLFKDSLSCNLNSSILCGGNDYRFLRITEQQFNDTTGIKYRIKNGVRTDLV